MNEVKELIKKIKNTNNKGLHKTNMILGIGKKHKDPVLVEFLIELLKDGDERIRHASCQALGDIGDPNALKPLAEIALNDWDYDTRKAAIQSLSELGDENALEPLIKLLEDNNVVIQKRAAWALGRMNNKKAIKPLQTSLQKVSEQLSQSPTTMLNLYKRELEDALKKLN